MSLMGTDEGAVPFARQATGDADQATSVQTTAEPSSTDQTFDSAERVAAKRASILFALAAACLVYPVVRFFVENL